jgi:hypothetical protein
MGNPSEPSQEKNQNPPPQKSKKDETKSVKDIARSRKDLSFPSDDENNDQQVS